MPINAKYSYNGVTPAVLAEITRLQAECETTVRARVALYKAIPNPRPADEALMMGDVTAIRNACDAAQNRLRTYKRQSFRDRDPAEFSDSEIVGSCFYQDEPYTWVFPDGTKNVTLTNSNADNVELPPGTILRGTSTNKQFIIANDGEYWIVDHTRRPLAPREPERFIKCGLSTDPRDIPAEKLPEPITWTKDPDRIKAEKIAALSMDHTRLEQILRDAGEIQGEAKSVPLGE